MGIRFYCPNGHKLNVKEFQAGRRGICPYCGARIQIPLHSTRPGTAPRSRQASTAEDMARQIAAAEGDAGDDSESSPDIVATEGPQSPAAAPAADAPRPGMAIASGPVAAPPTTPVRAVALPQGPASAPVRLAVKEPQRDVPPGAVPSAAEVAPPPTSTPPIPPPVQNDPIAEAPEMIWYVRPAAGGQFGPANGELMRTWITEGRIAAESLVWREGWRDWQEAGKVFPSLRANQIMDFLEATPIVHAGIPNHGHAHRPRKPDSGRTMATWIVMLVLAIILLAAAVLFEIFRPL